MMCNEYVYVCVIEILMGIEVLECVQYICIMYDEIICIFNYLMWLGFNVFDLGVMVVMLYVFCECEELMDCYEVVFGVCMYVVYYCLGGVYCDLLDYMLKYKELCWYKGKVLKQFNVLCEGLLLDFLENFIVEFFKCIDEYEILLIDNCIWKQCIVGIGVVIFELVYQWGMIGVMLCGLGIVWDLCKKCLYVKYDVVDFDILLGKEGDCYDCYLVCVVEMCEFNCIIKQCVVWLKVNLGLVMVKNFKVVLFRCEDMKDDMEVLIYYFKLFSEGYCVLVGEIYLVVEVLKGEFGCYLVFDGVNKLFCVYLCVLGFVYLFLIDLVVCGYMLVDVVVMIGIYDLVFGEVDW